MQIHQHPVTLHARATHFDLHCFGTQTTATNNSASSEMIWTESEMPVDPFPMLNAGFVALQMSESLCPYHPCNTTKLSWQM